MFGSKLVYEAKTKIRDMMCLKGEVILISDTEMVSIDTSSLRVNKVRKFK